MKINLNFFIVLIFSWSSLLDVNAQLIIGNLNVPPHFFGAKPSDGHFVKKATKVLDASEISYKIVTLPMERAYRELAEGNINVWISFKSPRYNEYMLYSNRELFELDVSVCSYETEQITLTDLHSKKITVIGGHLMGNLIYYFNNENHNIALETVRDGDVLTKMLIMKRTKYIIGYYKTIKYYLDKHNRDTSHNISFNCSSLKKEPVYMMLHKKTVDLDSYIEKINRKFPAFYSTN